MDEVASKPSSANRRLIAQDPDSKLWPVEVFEHGRVTIKWFRTKADAEGYVQTGRYDHIEPIRTAK